MAARSGVRSRVERLKDLDRHPFEGLKDGPGQTRNQDRTGGDRHHAGAVAQIGDQLKGLGLRGDVEGGGRRVGDDQFLGGRTTPSRSSPVAACRWTGVQIRSQGIRRATGFRSPQAHSQRAFVPPHEIHPGVAGSPLRADCRSPSILLVQKHRIAQNAGHPADPIENRVHNGRPSPIVCRNSVTCAGVASGPNMIDAGSPGVIWMIRNTVTATTAKTGITDRSLFPHTRSTASPLDRKAWQGIGEKLPVLDDELTVDQHMPESR
jgi:hypothetical protein